MSDELKTLVRARRTLVATTPDGIMIEFLLKASGYTFSELAKDAATDVLALYDADLAIMRKAVEELARSASPVSRVVRAVLLALTAKRPKTRYFLGWQARFAHKGMKVLSDHFRDLLVRKSLRLP